MLQSTAYSFSLVLGWLLIGDAAGIIVGVFAVGCAPNPERFFLWLQGAVTPILQHCSVADRVGASLARRLRSLHRV
jgi:hypothetical protein